MTILDEIKERVRCECGKECNRLGAAFFEEHLCVVAEYGAMLAEKIGGDREAVEIAGYLHDISAVRDFASMPRHAVESAVAAGEILRELGFATEKIAVVRNAIELHSTPLKIGEGSAEAVCLSNADAIAQIVRPAYWMFFAFGVRGMSFEDGRKWYAERVKSNREMMIEEARGLVGF